MKIMLVDDEQNQVDSLGIGLMGKGYEVLQTTSAREALNNLNAESDPIGLLITDYAMPEMNGLELLKSVRKRDSSLPVIMMTAFGEKAMVIEALRCRCNGFLEKPFSLDALLEEIQSVLHRQSDESFRLEGLKGDLPQLIHQFNNPLMVIRGHADMAQMGLTGESARKVKRSMEQIQAAVDKIAGLNQKIIELEKMKHGKMTPVDLKAIARGCLGMFADLAQYGGISIDADLGNQSLKMRGSRFGLEQMFNNLILNAIESMAESVNKRLVVSAKRINPANTIEVIVRDTGCGIPHHALLDIYKPFYTRKPQGTGLGLAVVSTTVKQHGGKISATSQPGQGTVFNLRLPIRREIDAGTPQRNTDNNGKATRNDP